MNRNGVQKSETLLVAIVLAVAAGMLDGYTYLVRGGVFASLQTGNMIFTGLTIAHGNWANVWQYVVPMLCFGLGVFCAECVRRKYLESNQIHWRQVVVIMEIIVIALTAFIPVGKLNMLASGLISFVSAMQIESFRKINGAPAYTTIMTGALRGAVQQLHIAVVDNDKLARKYCIQYTSIIACFICGVIVSTLLHRVIDKYSVFVAVIMLVIACLAMNSNGDAEHHEAVVMAEADM